MVRKDSRKYGNIVVTWDMLKRVVKITKFDLHFVLLSPEHKATVMAISLVLTHGQFQTASCQLIEIDNGKPRLGGSSCRSLHPVERCPGAPEPVALVPALVDARRSTSTSYSNSAFGSSSNRNFSPAHTRATHRSVTSARERLRVLPEVTESRTPIILIMTKVTVDSKLTKERHSDRSISFSRSTPTLGHDL